MGLWSRVKEKVIGGEVKKEVSEKNTNYNRCSFGENDGNDIMDAVVYRWL